MHRYEVFNPSYGSPLMRVPYAWMARLLVRWLRARHEGGLDGERTGEGWVR